MILKNIFLSNTTLKTSFKHHKHLKFNIEDFYYSVSWDDVFLCLSDNKRKSKSILTLDNFGFVLEDLSILDRVIDLENQYNNLDQSLVSSSHLYVSLTDTSKTFGWHNDDADVLFWQVIGKTFFSVEENSVVYNYELKKNDFLFIPRFTNHNTKPLTARVGVSFGLTKI